MLHHTATLRCSKINLERCMQTPLSYLSLSVYIYIYHEAISLHIQVQHYIPHICTWVNVKDCINPSIWPCCGVHSCNTYHITYDFDFVLCFCGDFVYLLSWGLLHWHWGNVWLPMGISVFLRMNVFATCLMILSGFNVFWLFIDSFYLTLYLCLYIVNLLLMTVTYQIYEWVIAIYDWLMGEWNERVNESYIAGTSEYIWYVIVTSNVLCIC